MRPCFRRSFLAALLLVPLAPAGLLQGDVLDPDKPPYLRPGDRAPAFVATDDMGRRWDSSQHYGRKAVVVCFYLGDFFPACTEELRVLRDAREMLASAGVEVVAVSGDSVATHELFKKTHRLNFPLLSDEKGAVGRAFGVALSGGGEFRMKHPDTGETITVARGVTPSRWTFVIGRDGRILARDTNVRPQGQPRRILELLAKQRK